MEKFLTNQRVENHSDDFEASNQDIAKIERGSGVVKIVGGSIEAQEKAKAMFSELFQAIGENKNSVNDLNIKQLRGVEKVKTPEELSLLEEVFEKLKEFVESYGGNSLALSPDHCIFIDQAKLILTQRLYYGLISGVIGASSSRHQNIALFNDKTEGSKLRLAQVVAHESLHLSSFQSFTILDSNKDVEGVNSDNLEIRRFGFIVVSNKDTKPVAFFKDINEAITEELVKIFDDKYLKNLPSLQDEVKKREDYSGHCEDVACVIAKDLYMFSVVTPRTYAYENQRSDFRKLIHTIYIKNKKDFSSEEEVFNVFARAYFDGSLLEIARLIEKTYGKGSFRSMAEKSEQNWTTDKNRE